MPAPVPLQERGMRAIPDGVSLVRDDVADRETGQGISVITHEGDSVSGASSTASVSARIAERITFGRKTKSGRNSTAAPMHASGSAVIPANRKNAGTAMLAASSAAMQVSPRQNQVRAGSAALSSSVMPAGSNIPMAWSTPRLKVRQKRINA